MVGARGMNRGRRGGSDNRRGGFSGNRRGGASGNKRGGISENRRGDLSESRRGTGKFRNNRGGNRGNRGGDRSEVNNNNNFAGKRNFRQIDNVNFKNNFLTKSLFIQRTAKRQEQTNRRRFPGGKKKPITAESLDKDLEGYWRKSEDTCK